MTTLLVASGGGHLTQLHLLLPRLHPRVGAARSWVTYETPQARSLLEGEDVAFGHSPSSRNLPNALRNFRLAGRLLEQGPFEQVVSTGAGIAVPFLVQARRRGIPAHYIESCTRVEGPSLSGRLLERVGGINLYTQHESWGRAGWRFAGSVLEHFTVSSQAGPRLKHIVVLTGTQRFPFHALVEAVRSILSPGDEVVWQLGTTPGHDLPGRAHSELPSAELDELMRRADVVIGHAGVGTALSALGAGKVPILIPRRKARAEHVDDHQVPWTMELQRLGLAIATEPDELTRSLLEQAAALRVEPASVPPFELAPG